MFSLVFHTLIKIMNFGILNDFIFPYCFSCTFLFTVIDTGDADSEALCVEEHPRKRKRVDSKELSSTLAGLSVTCSSYERGTVVLNV